VPSTLRNLKEDLEDVGSRFDGARVQPAQLRGAEQAARGLLCACAASSWFDYMPA